MRLEQNKAVEKQKKMVDEYVRKARALIAGREKYVGIGIAAIVIIIIAVSIQPGMSFECDYMSMGWLDDFSDSYQAMPQDAIQCDNARGSFVAVKFGADISGDVRAKMAENLIDVARSDDLDYYDQICSSSGGICCNDVIVYGGKINAVGEISGNLVIITVDSQSPEAASSFLEGVWASQGTIASMLA